MLLNITRGYVSTPFLYDSSSTIFPQAYQYITYVLVYALSPYKMYNSRLLNIEVPMDWWRKVVEERILF